jgi:PAS domain S-box-containing protein
MDISDRKYREEQLRLLELVVVNTNDSVLITEAEPIDPPGPRIVYVNPAFERMTGYSLEEVIAKTPRILQGAKTNRAELDRIRALSRRCSQFGLT